MTPSKVHILHKLFDEDFVHLDDFAESDKHHLRDLWQAKFIKLNESTKLFSITPEGCNALGGALMEAEKARKAAA